MHHRPAAAGGVRAEPALDGKAGADDASEARVMVGRTGAGPGATTPSTGCGWPTVAKDPSLKVRGMERPAGDAEPPAGTTLPKFSYT